MKEKETIIDKLGRFITMAGNAILMNLLFLVACIPVVTIGQAWCGLMGAIRYNIRGEKWIVGFKVGFKTRFFRGTLVWIVGLLAALFFMWDMNAALATGDTVTLIASSLMFAFVTMLLHAALTLNVYIYTGVATWLKNAVDLLFKTPLQLLLSAAMFWLPILGVLVLMPDDPGIIYLVLEFSLVFLCVYYTLAALVTTMALKGGLLDTLLSCRAEGLIIAEEGAMPIEEDEVEDDE